MATRFIDIGENTKLGQTNILALAVSVGAFLVVNAFMQIGLAYLLVSAIAILLPQFIFYYKPRYIRLSTQFLFTNSSLSPSFTDDSYLEDESLIDGIRNITKGRKNAQRWTDSSSN